MNEEEKEAIEYLERHLLPYCREGNIKFMLNDVILNLIKKQQKVIDEMASYLSIIRACPNEDCGANIDCERRCNLTDELQKECWKIYFNRRVEWGD